MPAKTADSPIAHRYDIAYFLEVTDGNPNGDPDAGNLPRLDPETNHGLVTDVCLKRKVRNYVALKHGGKPPHDIYVTEKAVLNQQHERAYEALKIKPDSKTAKEPEKARALTAWMCQNFFDIRTFGAVMTTEVNCGQVRGPIQFTLARSVHPVLTHEHAVTRCAVTNERDQEKERTMGRKFTLPYALYRASIFISPLLADPGRLGTGFSDADLSLFKEALSGMFDHDRSAARGTMAPVACFAFRHDHPMGQARADQLMALIRCEPSADVKSGRPPRSRADFTISCDDRDLPTGVTLEKWI